MSHQHVLNTVSNNTFLNIREKIQHRLMRRKRFRPRSIVLVIVPLEYRSLLHIFEYNKERRYSHIILLSMYNQQGQIITHKCMKKLDGNDLGTPKSSLRSTIV